MEPRPDNARSYMIGYDRTQVPLCFAETNILLHAHFTRCNSAACAIQDHRKDRKLSKKCVSCKTSAHICNTSSQTKIKCKCELDLAKVQLQVKLCGHEKFCRMIFMPDKRSSAIQSKVATRTFGTMYIFVQ